jgi:DNA-binding MarR family transcriptional regulator
MNYSDTEIYGNRTDDDLLEAAMPLLQALGPALHAAVLHVAQANHLTPAQAKLLLQLSTHGQMTMGEIAAGLCVSMPAASELVDRLVDAGHLVRDTDPSDRRRVLIAPTPEARRIGTHFCNLRRARLRYALEQLSPADRPLFVRSLEALLAALTHDEEDRSMPCPRADAAVGDTVTSDDPQRTAASLPKTGSKL